MNISELSKLRYLLMTYSFVIQSITQTAAMQPFWFTRMLRVDQQRLDKVVGPLNWKREHTNGNRNCIASIWCPEKGQWVSKEDTIAHKSNTQRLKRAWQATHLSVHALTGVLVESFMITQAGIQVQLHQDEIQTGNGKAQGIMEIAVKRVWNLATPNLMMERSTFLAGKDANGKLRFKWGIIEERQRCLINRAHSRPRRNGKCLKALIK